MTTTAQQPTIFFIRHGKLALPYKDHAAMPQEILTALGLKKIDPPVKKIFIDEQIKLFLKSSIPLADIQQIYTSPSRRCIETADHLNNYIKETTGQKVKQTTSPLLQEINFELDKILADRPKPSDIESLNNLILTAMSSADHCESADAGLSRIISFFSESQNFFQPTIIVTHDFIMRTIELFIRQQGTPASPITLDHLLSTQRNDYLHGFATDAKFSFLKKI